MSLLPVLLLGPEVGEYRDQTEILVQTDRVEKDPGVWKTELSKAAREPEKMVFSYWYKGTYADRTIRDMDMRFITFEESTVQNIVFQNCNLKEAVSEPD